jgi:lipopolysaccharide transport system ATP-binding protein
MSSENIVIEIKSLSKVYHIYDRPSYRLKQMFSFNRKKYYREFWAIKNVSFQLKKGETVGIIGRNGSGKSTLLQMLCGILNPTNGTINIKGRIAALLELGSGFNQEFTGRENIYMNATLLGLSNEEIKARFDSIVKFADIGNFIDQPVKKYSSGMTIRLAFAINAHVDADILIVDEALAVGDIAFQAKCYSLLANLKKSGVSFILVSHDINTLRNISDKVLWLNSGKVQMYGDKRSVLDEYIKSQHLEINKNINPKNLKFNNSKSYGNKKAIILNVDICDERNKKIQKMIVGKNYKIYINAFFEENVSNVSFGFYLKNNAGQPLLGLQSSNNRNFNFSCKKNKSYKFEICFKNYLNTGSYNLQVQIERIISHNNVHEFLHVLEDVKLLESIQGSGSENIFHSMIWSECEFNAKEA